MPVPSVNETLLTVLGSGLRRSSRVSGGDINDAFCLTLDDGSKVFMKANRGVSTDFFQAEAEGLEAIRATGAISAPGVIAVDSDADVGAFLLLEWVDPAPRATDFWENFGRSLAMMHAAPTLSRFGWLRDNAIGASPQCNAQRDSWVEFYRDCRLAPQLRRAWHWLDAGDRKRADHLLAHLESRLVEPARPALLHGDLWSGNFITGGDGRAWLIDPAVYAGHPEADLAMTELFGGFHARFYAAYREAAGLQPGYGERRDLYNLYHLLNHLNLFGGGYLGAVRDILSCG